MMHDFQILGPQNKFAAHINDQNSCCHALCVCVCVCVWVCESIAIVVVPYISCSQGHWQCKTTSTCDIRKSRSLKYNRRKEWGRAGENGGGGKDRGNLVQHIYYMLLYKYVVFLLRVTSWVLKKKKNLVSSLSGTQAVFTHTHTHAQTHTHTRTFSSLSPWYMCGACLGMWVRVLLGKGTPWL